MWSWVGEKIPIFPQSLLARSSYLRLTHLLHHTLQIFRHLCVGACFYFAEWTTIHHGVSELHRSHYRLMAMTQRQTQKCNYQHWLFFVEMDLSVTERSAQHKKKKKRETKRRKRKNHNLCYGDKKPCHKMASVQHNQRLFVGKTDVRKRKWRSIKDVNDHTEQSWR